MSLDVEEGLLKEKVRAQPVEKKIKRKRTGVAQGKGLFDKMMI